MILDDDASQCSHWSMTEYGALDWNPSGDEFDDFEVSPKITRRRSSVSPRDAATVRAVSLDAAESRGRRVHCEKTTRRASMSSPTDAAKVQAAFHKAVTPKKRKAKSVPPLGRKTCSVVRDAHGRFAPKASSPTTIPNRKRSASTPAVVGRSRKTLAPGVKKETRVAPPKRIDFKVLKSSPVINATIPIAKPLQESVSPPKPTCSALDASSEKKASGAKRDAKGRFASKDKAATAHIEEPLATKVEPKIKVVIPAKAKAKAKRAPAKSPYFTPPVTPLKPRKVKKEAPTSINTTSSQQLTPVKGDESVPLSQGSAKKRISGKTVSCIPFPPLSAPYFGLIQEKLANDPFRLLIAVTFLIRTHGKHAIPVFYELMEKYPTPEALVAAEKHDIVPIIRHLGLQNQRASTYQTYAKIWLEDPPLKDKRYPVRGYPDAESGRDVKKGETILDSDDPSAWEIGHMTQGPYAIDSWRIFCRDVLRGVAGGYNGEGSEEGFQPEWMRVVPEDKELRAYLRWMWLKEGFEWDPFTGEKEAARKDLMKAAIGGRIAWDDAGGMRILDKVMDIEPGLSQVGNLDI